jgi:Flp pilus assembly protein TadG
MTECHLDSAYFRKFIRKLDHFRRDERGNIALVFGLAGLMTNAACAKFQSRMFMLALYLFGRRSPSAAPSGLLLSPGTVGQFRANQNGSSAVEFAIVAAPFLAILLGALELALIFIVNIGLNVATEALATQIRTGQVQAPGIAATSSSGVQMDLADAKTALCNQIQIVSSANCIQQLQIDVRPLTSFQQTSSASPIAGSTFNSSNLCYYSGNAGDVVEMRAYYLYPLIDPLLSYAFSVIKNYISSSGSSSGNYYPIQTTQVFKSESYSGLSNSGAGC